MTPNGTTPSWQTTIVRAYLNEATRLRTATGGVLKDEFLVAVGHNESYPAALDLTDGWGVHIDVLKRLVDACVEEVVLRWGADRERRPSTCGTRGCVQASRLPQQPRVKGI